MPNTLSASRADVIRMVARYVQLAYSPRSMAGRLVVDESRLARKRETEIELDSASSVQILDAIRTAMIRRAVYAPPVAPTVTNDQGEAIRRVMPAKAVAPIVRMGSHRGGGSDSGGDTRDWRGTVSQKLAAIPRDAAQALVKAEEIRCELLTVRNQLSAARSDVGRLRGSGKQTRNLRRDAEARVFELKSQETKLGASLEALTHSDAYRTGVADLLTVCTRTPQITAYCFPWLLAIAA
jgi:hypothetical protein